MILETMISFKRLPGKSYQSHIMPFVINYMATVKAPFHYVPAELLLHSYCTGGLVRGLLRGF